MIHPSAWQPSKAQSGFKSGISLRRLPQNSSPEEFTCAQQFLGYMFFSHVSLSLKKKKKTSLSWRKGIGIGVKKRGNGELCVCRDGREEIVGELTHLDVVQR